MQPNNSKSPGLLHIRKGQSEILAKSFVASHVIEDFRKAGAIASFDSSTGDIFVSIGAGQAARLQLDENGRLSRVTTPLGRTAEYRTRELSTSVCTAGGLQTELARDANGRPLSVTVGGRAYKLEYEGGNVSRINFPDGTSFHVEYTAEHRPRRFRDRLGHTVTYEYGDRNLVAAIVAPNGRRTEFNYGEWNRPKSIVYPDSSTEHIKYADSGLPVGTAWNDSPLAHLEQDANGRLKNAQFADGTSLKLSFDDQDHVQLAANSDITVRCEYDSEGRLTLEAQGDQIIRYHHNDAGLLSSMILPDGSTLEYSYDADGRLAEIRDWNHNLHKFNYETGDHPIERILPNGLQETYSYDAAGNLLTLDLSGAGHALHWMRSDKRDSMDRKIELNDSRQGKRKVAYDAEGRVLSMEAPDGKETFSYDPNGSRTTINGSAVTSDALDRVVSLGEITYEYDARGNRTAAYDRRGATRYTYNDLNNLVKVELPDDRVVTYTYDAFGRRVRKTIANVTTEYLWSGHQVIAEITRDGAKLERREYLFLPGSHKPLAMRLNGSVFFVHSDELGTPQLLTDMAGGVAWAGKYTTLGHCRPEAQLVRNSLRFPGQYFDEETGLHYNRCRYYDPRIGIYLSRDPFGLLAGTNLYWYANGDPVNCSDPTGCWGESFPSWMKTTISVAGGVVAGVAIGALAVAAAPLVLGVAAGGAIAMGLGIIAGGMAAGAVGYSLNASMTPNKTSLDVLKEGARGLLVGGLAALPFLALPAAGTVAAGMWAAGVLSAGALSGQIGYVADCATSPRQFDTGDFLLATGIGVASAGILGLIAPRVIGALRATPTFTYDLTPGIDEGQEILFGQKGVSPRFGHGKLEGMDIDDVVAKLKSGELTPDDLPVRYIWVNGKKVAVNNRSLTALSKAGMKPTKTIDMSGNLPAEGDDSQQSVLERLNETDGQPSREMPVRTEKDRSSPTRETVPLPDQEE